VKRNIFIFEISTGLTGAGLAIALTIEGFCITIKVDEAKVQLKLERAFYRQNHRNPSYA